MNQAVMGIARNTFKEGVRDRLFVMIGVFAAVVIVSSLVIGPLSLGEQVRITQDLGLAAISVLSSMPCCGAVSGTRNSRMANWPGRAPSKTAALTVKKEAPRVGSATRPPEEQ